MEKDNDSADLDAQVKERRRHTNSLLNRADELEARGRHKKAQVLRRRAFLRGKTGKAVDYVLRLFYYARQRQAKKRKKELGRG